MESLVAKINAFEFFLPFIIKKFEFIGFFIKLCSAFSVYVPKVKVFFLGYMNTKGKLDLYFQYRYNDF